MITAVDQGEVEDGVLAAVNNHLAVASSQVGPGAGQRVLHSVGGNGGVTVVSRRS